jgi:hypothetical protein
MMQDVSRNARLELSLNFLTPIPVGEVSLTCPVISLAQGGGVRIVGGTTTFTGCNIYDNEAYNVSARLLNFS